MLSSNGFDVITAAAIAALSSEVVIHPLDTIITRMQCKDYTAVYKHTNGALRRTLFAGLYQGFGPTLFAGIPSSAAFFVTYEASKTSFERAQLAGYLGGVPKSIFHAASSAAAELVACAFLNPAEVLKQNAQVSQSGSSQARVNQANGGSTSIEILRQFSKKPSALWAGYWMLVTGQLPSICLTFCLYESFKESLHRKQSGWAESFHGQVQASLLCAGAAGGCSSWFFVPIDVVKTRLRLAVGDEMQSCRPVIEKLGHGTAGMSSSVTSRPRALAIIQDVFMKEGIPGFFRGSWLTCLAATLGSAMYIGCYEGTKLCLATPTSSF